MIRRVLDLMAKLGLSVRDDPARVIDPAQRIWGEASAGWTLSLENLPVSDPAGLPSVSVVLRNVSAEKRALTVPGWTFFYRMDVRTPDGAPIDLSGFGRQLLNPERRMDRLDLDLAPGALVEAQIPIGTMYGLKPRDRCRVRARCEVAGGVVVESNEVSIGS